MTASLIREAYGSDTAVSRLLGRSYIGMEWSWVAVS